MALSKSNVFELLRLTYRESFARPSSRTEGSQRDALMYATCLATRASLGSTQRALLGQSHLDPVEIAINVVPQLVATLSHHENIRARAGIEG